MCLPSTLNILVLLSLFLRRRYLTDAIRKQMIDRMNIVDLRISQLELDHQTQATGPNQTLYCVFTLLDRTPFVSVNEEIALSDARDLLKRAIDNEQFRIETNDSLFLRAIPNSLENIEYFYLFNPNPVVNQTHDNNDTIVVINRTIVEIVQTVYEKVQYSDGSRSGAVVGGMIVGIIGGTFMVLVGMQMIKRKARLSPTGGLTFRNISFRVRSRHQQDEPSILNMDDPLYDREVNET
jgi:hypothetical protein